MILHARVCLLLAAIVLLVLAALGVPARRIGLGWLGLACAVLAYALPLFVAA